jgi:hypothetical protein
MAIPRGWYQAWSRSIPVENRVSGLGIDGATALRDLREYDPAVRIMWDTMRQAVVVWRQPRAGEFPVLVADSPFGHVVDQRLARWLIQSDTHRYRGFNDLMARLDEERDRKERERFHQQFNSIDHGRLYHAMQHDQAQRIGKPLGLMSQVPEQIHAGE